MMPPGGSDRAKQFAVYAILGMLADKTPEQLADDYLEALDHRDWCDYRLDILKGLSVRRPCDCPGDKGRL